MEKCFFDLNHIFFANDQLMECVPAAEKPQMKVIIYCFDSTVGPFRFMGDTFLTFTPIKALLLHY